MTGIVTPDGVTVERLIVDEAGVRVAAMLLHDGTWELTVVGERNVPGMERPFYVRGGADVVQVTRDVCLHVARWRRTSESADSELRAALAEAQSAAVPPGAYPPVRQP